MKKLKQKLGAIAQRVVDWGMGNGLMQEELTADGHDMVTPEMAALARRAGAEGCVLLKNDDKALPIRKGERVSVFGRIQFDYYKSGTGSGGAVNTRYVTNILDALKENKDISVNEELEQTYRDWLKDHPFEKGMGWAQEPWCQEEMPVTKELAEQAAAKSDIAVIRLRAHIELSF